MPGGGGSGARGRLLKAANQVAQTAVRCDFAMALWARHRRFAASDAPCERTEEKTVQAVVLMPRLTSQSTAGWPVRKPRTSPTCIRNTKVTSEGGGMNSKKCSTSIHPLPYKTPRTTKTRSHSGFSQYRHGDSKPLRRPPLERFLAY